MKKGFKKSKAGISLVEVSIAMAITAFTCGGLYSMGIAVRRSSERMRVATEAQSYAKEVLEEMIARDAVELALPTINLMDPSTIESSTGASLTRTVQLNWHNATGTVVSNFTEGGYAEVHVSVDYPAPRSGKTLTDTYSTIIN